MKSFSIGRGTYLQIRAEAYNALNKVNLGNPGTTLGTANFGRILSAGGARTHAVRCEGGLLSGASWRLVSSTCCSGF